MGRRRKVKITGWSRILGVQLGETEDTFKLHEIIKTNAVWPLKLVIHSCKIFMNIQNCKSNITKDNLTYVVAIIVYINSYLNK